MTEARTLARVEHGLLHEICIECPGHWSRDQAAENAIAYVRDYIKTLPEGFRLTQACPQRHVTLNDNGVAQERWVVYCTCRQKAAKNELPWAQKLDTDWEELRTLAAFQRGDP